MRCHLDTMRRLNIRYDLLTWEGDILRLHFWTHAFEFLKKIGAVFLQTEGRLKGCWVMKIEEDEAGETPEYTSGDSPVPTETPEGDAPASDTEPREKVIVRSDGTVTYVGKDMAYQLWKFGLLGKDFHYRVFAERPGEPALWSTTLVRRRPDAPTRRRSGGRRWVCNVIDTRQSYLQKLLKQALAALGYEAQAGHSVHYAYEMVALSHATARELGYEIDVEADRPFVEVSGRKGLGVKADDLIDRLTLKASGEVSKRNPELTPDQVRRIAEAIAIAAVRYFMVKFSRGKVIIFDIDEALSFEGESGPVPPVRRRAREQHLQQAQGTRRHRRGGRSSCGRRPRRSSCSTADTDEALDLWGLVLEAARLDDVVEQAIRTLELSIVAKYAFGLAQAVQRVLPSLFDHQRRARRCPHLARSGGRLLSLPSSPRRSS